MTENEIDTINGDLLGSANNTVRKHQDYGDEKKLLEMNENRPN